MFNIVFDFGHGFLNRGLVSLPYGFRHGFIKCGLVSPLKLVLGIIVFMHLGLASPTLVTCCPEVPCGPFDTYVDIRGHPLILWICIWYWYYLWGTVFRYKLWLRAMDCSGREPAGRWSINLRRDGCTASGRGSPPGTKPEYFHLWKLGTNLVHFHLWTFRTCRLVRLWPWVFSRRGPQTWHFIRYVLTWTRTENVPGCFDGFEWCVHVSICYENCINVLQITTVRLLGFSHVFKLDMLCADI